MRTPDPEVIEAIERDAGAGMSVNQIAKKHGIGWATARRYAPRAKEGKRTVTTAHKNGRVTLELTPELAELVWHGLSLEKKAELLKRLHG